MRIHRCATSHLSSDVAACPLFCLDTTSNPSWFSWICPDRRRTRSRVCEAPRCREGDGRHIHKEGSRGVTSLGDPAVGSKVRTGRKPRSWSGSNHLEFHIQLHKDKYSDAKLGDCTLLPVCLLKDRVHSLIFVLHPDFRSSFELTAETQRRAIARQSQLRDAASKGTAFVQKSFLWSRPSLVTGASQFLALKPRSSVHLDESPLLPDDA